MCGHGVVFDVGACVARRVAGSARSITAELLGRGARVGARVFARGPFRLRCFRCRLVRVACRSRVEFSRRVGLVPWLVARLVVCQRCRPAGKLAAVLRMRLVWLRVLALLVG